MTLNDWIILLLAMAIPMHVILGACAYLILLERKLSAWMQDRVGPNRAGPMGLLQPLADGIKFILKEEMMPGHINKFLYVLAPGITCFTALFAFAVVPYGPTSSEPAVFPFIIAPNVDLGLLFLFAVGSLNVYGIILGGWASNNKYSALGALRASAQVVSYEIPLGMSVLGVILLAGSMNIETIMNQQIEHGFMGWNIWYQPLAALLFFTAAMAESNRLPFDLAECEQELVGGFHTEYSSMKFAMFALGEYVHITTLGFVLSCLYFGGWHFPWIATAESAYPGAWAVKVLVLLTKVFAVLVLIQLLRWTIPRFRFDQLMGLAWKVMIPLATVNVLMVMCFKQFGWDPMWMLPGSLAIFICAGVVGVQSARSGRSLAAAA